MVEADAMGRRGAARILRRRFLLLVLVVAVPATLLSVNAFYRERERLIETRVRAVDASIGMVAADLRRLLEGGRQFLGALSEAPVVRSRSQFLDACDAYLARLLSGNSRYGNLGIAESDGSVTCNGRGREGRLNLSDRLYFQQSIDQPGFVVREFAFGRLSGRPVLVMAQSVVDEGRRAIAFLSMDVSEMARGIGGLALPAGASVWVTDRNGTVLASQPPAAGRVGEAVPDDILARALREHGQVLSPLEMERDGWLLRAHPAGVDDAGQLWVAARMDRAVLAGEAGTRLLGILVLSIASFGLVALGVVLLSERYLWSPLQRLVSMARRVMRGDLAARSGQPPDRADEVGILASAMDTMAEALEARDLRQHEIEARLRALNANLDTAQRIALLGSWEANAPDGLLLSPEAARILGCSPLSPVVSIDALLARFEAADGARLRSALEAAMRDGSPFELELRLAGNLRQMLFRGETSVRDGGGPFIAYGTVQDVTERRRADDELQRAQARLLQADKLASIGELAAGLAHEINNPLGYVYSNLNTMAVYIETLLRLLDAVLNLERDGRLPPELARQLQELRAQTDFEYVGNDLLPVLDECREGLERVRKIVKDLRDFSRADQPADWAACDIHVPLERTLGILRSEFRQKAEVRREYGILPEVMCNEGQLQQVFMNLLVNAVQSIEQQGRITVRTGHSGDQVFVEIADNGCGIDPENLGNLFTPFFTTKRPGVGTGLGLSVSQTLVARHHGRIEAYSTVGEGSRFVVWLPVRQPEAGPELALPAVRAVASAPSMPS